MYQTLFQNLTPQDVIITVNKRLTLFLYERYNAWRQQQNISAWFTPTILPLASWLEQLWQNNQANAHGTPLNLLTTHQAQIIWEQIIANSSWGKHLLQINVSAQLAREAWALCQQWQIDTDTQHFAQTEDTQAWQQWAQAFKKHCEINNWLDAQRLPNYIADGIAPHLSLYPKKIFLMGFTELTPSVQYLLNTLKKHGCTFQVIEQQATNSSIQKLALKDTATEIHTMARWCQQQLLQDPNTTIACVAPDFASHRTQLFNIFSEYHLPFNIAGGLLLGEYPMIHTALTLLNLRQEVTFEAISLLLRSPFLGGAEQEIAARAELDVLLRKQGEQELTCQQIISFAKQHRCPLLGQHMQACLALQQRQTKSLRPSQWTQLFSQQLIALGWPGERTLSSTEYQLYERWQTLLAELASLDAVLTTIDANSARNQLYKLSATPFQPQSAVNARIQILGVLEAAGLYSQQAWIMGMHDDAWPTPAKPNPFIPYHLQRQLGLPHSSSERELRFCRTLTEQLLQSANNIICSFPQYADDRPLRVSRLIAAVPTVDINNLELLPEPVSRRSCASGNPEKILEYFTDNTAPPITPDEHIHGGSAILKYQAACPFHAFARFRLGAEAFAKMSLGLSAKTKGALLHDALEILWNTLGDQNTLLKLSTEKLQTIVQQTIDTALLSSVKKHPLTFKKHFTELEKKRLTILLHNWLEQERQRPAFKVIAMEQAQEFTVGQIPLKLRLDRLDELSDGTRIIIDYKSGNVSTNAWLGERLDEPQLPLYCVASTQPIKGLLFAQIKNNKASFQGIAAADLQIKGIKHFTGWQILLKDWQTALEKLAQEFSEGHALVDPKYDDKTCQQCDLQLLCRIKEKN